nr:DNA-directed DNA polymerase, family B [Abalone asfa-like virus]
MEEFAKINQQFISHAKITNIRDRQTLISSKFPDLFQEVNQKIKRGEPILFLPNDVIDEYYTHNGKHCYRLRMFGLTKDGSKTDVLVQNVPVILDVKVENESQELDVRNICTTLGIPVKITFVNLRPLKEFREPHEATDKYARLHFNNLFDRKKVFEIVTHKYMTASDEMSHYYRMISRMFDISLTSWNWIKNYDHGLGEYALDRQLFDFSSTSISSAFHVFVVDYNNITPVVDMLADDETQKQQDQLIQNSICLSKDHSLLAVFDIETAGGIFGELPTAENGGYVFLLCMHLYIKHSLEPLDSIVITTRPTLLRDDSRIILCKSEDELIQTFGIIMKYWAPDFISGFNDTEYDWKFLLDKAANYDILPDLFQKLTTMSTANHNLTYTVKRHMREKMRIKISVENAAFLTFIRIPGCVNIDVRVIYRKLFPSAEKSSLAFFLKMSNLPPKDDMSVVELWRIADSGNAKEMDTVTQYCLIDAKRCQELLFKRNVINDHRKIGELSFTSMFDCMFYAGAHKVRNMVMGFAGAEGFACSHVVTQTNINGKYPGAYVLDPIKGLQDQFPVVGLDFASLYPSLIMTYNYSPDKFVKTYEKAKDLESKGYDIKHVKFKIGIDEFEGWFVRHKNVPSDLGVYPRMLISLKQKRVLMKKEMKKWESVKEKEEIILSQCQEGGSFYQVLEKNKHIPAHNWVKTGNEKQDFEKFVINHDETIFKYTMCNSKQGALKIFMNTFYGEAGFNRSPLFLVQLAAGITISGQENLKKVEQLVRSKGYQVLYGDTDSLYITGTLQDFIDEYTKYKNSRQTHEDYKIYSEEIVRKTMKIMDILRDQVNKYLEHDNGTKFLQMAYEEVLFPVVFTGKKKYYGIAHVNEPNFSPKKLFIRGIEIIKQGQTKLSKEIGNKIMWESMKLRQEHEKRSLIMIVEQVLNEAVLSCKRGDFGPDYFLQSDVYRPRKDNRSVKIFFERLVEDLNERKQMLEQVNDDSAQNYSLPLPGERFFYYVTDIPGSRKGDKMILKEIFEDNLDRYQIDFRYYLVNYVIGVCARFINYDQRFVEVAQNSIAQKTLDAKCQDAAKRYLEKKIDIHFPKNKVVARKKIGVSVPQSQQTLDMVRYFARNF